MSQLKFNESEIGKIASRCEIPGEEKCLIKLKERITDRGFLTKDDLRQVAKWKSRRSAWRVEKNDPAFVEEITRFAFVAHDERSRIELLTLLDGVAWPTASAILHLLHPDKYPILDFRALWSASLEVPGRYNFPFSRSYVEFCRNAADRLHVDMRTLDRAMWQYSKDNQLTRRVR